MRSPSLQQLSPSPNFIEDSSYAPHIDARQRVRQHNRQRRRKAKEDDERRAVEEKERQERVQKSVPQVEAQRRRAARRAAELSRREKGEQDLVVQEQEQLLSARRERAKRYMTPETVREVISLDIRPDLDRHAAQAPPPARRAARPPSNGSRDSGSPEAARGRRPPPAELPVLLAPPESVAGPLPAEEPSHQSRTIGAGRSDQPVPCNALLSGTNGTRKATHVLECMLKADLEILLLTRMPWMNSVPDGFTYGSAISACEKSGQWHDACKSCAPKFHQLQRGNLRLRERQMGPSRATADQISLNAAISAAGKEGLLRMMSEARVVPDAMNYNAAISACEKTSSWRFALSLLIDMPRMRLLPTAVSCNEVSRRSKGCRRMLKDIKTSQKQAKRRST
ncbi:unnamed protein product [Polarella glacialis]|uniref:Pentatricopeptide repeat-containing protein n=1 Tax=Polarella glacialis TaxID=89957 RepID=A0A813F8Z9_POLGL|nr:unnamed protein product [Polarella glacialis]